MNTRLGIAPKLMLVFVLFAVLLVAIIGTLAYRSGRTALEAATISDLSSEAIQKQAALKTWVHDREAGVVALSQSPHTISDVAVLTQASEPSQETYDHLVRELQTRTGFGAEFLSLLVIEPEAGKVIASTDAAEEGKFREDQPYFINGKNSAYVQSLYYSTALRGPAMTASAPLRSPEGTLLGVLAGRLNLTDVSNIISRRTGLRRTDDSYLVNTSGLFATQPRFISDPAVLQRGVHTEQVKHCLAGNSGVVYADDYRGVPVIAVYRWLPEQRLCLIVEVDQAEVFESSHALGRTLGFLGLGVLLVAAVLAFGLTRTITQPVRALQIGAVRYGQGDLAHRIEIKTGDEIGTLAAAMNAMAASLQATQAENARLYGETQAWAAELEQRVQAQTDIIRASEEQLRLVAANAPIVLWASDREGIFTLSEGKGLEAQGLKPGQLVGQSVFEVYRDLPSILADNRRALNGEAFTALVEVAGLVFETHYAPLRDRQGEIIGVTGVSVDITERKRAEEALHESEDRYRTLAEASPDMIFVIGRDDRVQYVNSFAARQFKNSAADIIGRRQAEIFPSQEASRQTESLHAVMQTGKAILSESHVSFPGHERWLSTWLVPMVDAAGQVSAVMGISRDITEAKRTEEVLRDSEERFRAIFERSTIGKSLTAPDGALLQVNKAFAQMLGYTIEEAQRVNFAQITHPDDIVESRECIRCLLANERPDYRMEKRYFHKNGDIVWADVSTTLLRDGSGAALYFITSVQDITDHKRAAQTLAQQTEDLDRSNRELERFAYVASHDLQEPLRMVTSYLQLIERRYSDRLDGDAHEFMGYAVDGANRMKALINDLLAYSRVGTQGKPFGPVDCETSLAQATANLQVAIEENAAHVTHDPLPVVTGDDGQLTQLFQNLIGNAVKFHGAEPPRIHVSARETFEVSGAKVWEFSVRDNGIGMDPKYFDRIFVIFQRLHTRDKYLGTGIGLAISKRIAERHGGRIWVESQPGHGATFYFTLPA